MLTSKRSLPGTSPIRLHDGSGAALWLGANSLYDRLTINTLLLRGRSPAHRRSWVSLAGHPCNACVAPFDLLPPSYNANRAPTSKVAMRIQRTPRFDSEDLSVLRRPEQCVPSPFGPF